MKLLNDRITAGCVVVVVCGGAKHTRGKFIADLFASVSGGLILRGDHMKRLAKYRFRADL